MIKIYSPTAILGYGFPLESHKEAYREKPDLIAVDAGSTDPGPYYLGKGISFVEAEAVKRDLSLLLTLAKDLDIPLIIGSAGGCGTKSSVDFTYSIVESLCKELNIHFKVSIIYTDVDKERVKKALKDGNIRSLDGSFELNESIIDRCTNITAQIGIEPFMEAIKEDAQVIIAGRSYDPAPFAVIPVMKGYDMGLSLHLGKILECGAIASEPGSGRDGLIGVLSSDYFDVFPLNPRRRCTVLSVSAHTLYEKSDPYHLAGPDGTISLEETKFSQINERMVRVTGTKFIPPKEKWIKIEGAEFIGFRSVCFAGIRDPIFISQIDNILSEMELITKENFPDWIDKFKIHFHLYGKNGVMGKWEKNKEACHEIGLLIEVLSENEKIAKTVIGFIRSTLLHYGYPGRISTAGNLAFPFSPSDVIWGEVFRFSIYHLIKENYLDISIIKKEV
ncbi:MAG: 3-methylaspartate ammonia-lyase [Dictyoglomus sp. NZ13-RE01]|nr:MAG: 3-methylaspartate ammonia-lyase [Dictyoglomus sp. NZ13-RE01]